MTDIDTIEAEDALPEETVETVTVADPNTLVPIPLGSLNILLACAAFARDMVEGAWKEQISRPDDVFDLAEHYGLLEARKPTPEELADPMWWGHAAAIGPDDEQVGEFAPGLLAILDALVESRPELDGPEEEGEGPVVEGAPV